MSELRATNPIYLVWAGAYYVLRSRVFWILVAIALIFWFWRGQEETVDIAAQEAFYEQAMEAEIDRLIAEGKAQSLISASGRSSNSKDRKAEPAFFFTPMLCEAIATRANQKLGRMPTNWTDIVASGVTEKIPPPRKGHKYVYDPKLGAIEEVSIEDSENPARQSRNQSGTAAK